MSLLPISVQPGLYTETSDRANLNRYKNGSNVRFWKGNAEKIGGWVHQISTAFFGIARSIVAWTTLSYQPLIGIGTNSKLYLTDTVNLYDITPLDGAGGALPNNPVTTTLNSKTVTIQDTAHGRSAGDFVQLAGLTAVGGITMNGDWPIDNIVDANNYQIVTGTQASASLTGGGAAGTFKHYLPSGQKDSVLGTGWGAGGWGEGTWGTARISSILTLCRIWNLALWGEDLLASPLDAGIYVWVATTGTGANAVLISAAPAQNRKILVSDQLRILISFGSYQSGAPDPMLIRWSDTENYSNWTPSPTNLAGDARLDGGNQIITAVQTNTDIAVITDTKLWSMTMTGDDLVFALTPKGEIPGLLGPNAAIEVGGTVYAMGFGNFYSYNGAISILPCDVHSKVFGTPQAPGFNVTQAAKTYAARNRLKNEIIWFYCSANSTEIDSCVGINLTDNTWWLGSVPRTAWLDTTPFFEVPVALGPTLIANQDVNAADAAGVDSLLYLQETGVDADGAALPYFIETYDMEISATSNMITGVITGAGEYIYKAMRLFPDFSRLVGNHFATLKGRKYPQDGKQIVKGPKKFYPDKPRVDIHIRARQISVRLESSEIGADMSMGAWRGDVKIQGTR